MWWLIFVLLLIFTVILHYYYVIYTNQVTGKITGPFAWPLIGNLWYFRQPNDLLDVAQRFFTKHGPRVRFYLGYKLNVFLADPKDCKVVLESHELRNKTEDYNFFVPWLGSGIFTSNGDEWRQRRKRVMPAFHTKYFANLVPLIEKQGDILIEKLKLKSDGNAIDVYPDLCLLSVDVFSNIAMGVSVNAQSGSGKKYVKAVSTMCKIIGIRHRNLIKRWQKTFVFTKDYQIQQNAVKILHDFSDNILKQRKQILQNEGKDLETRIAECGENKNLLFLDLLLSLKIDGEPIPDSYVRDEIDTFYLGGFDTTSITFSMILYELSRAPDIQEKLYQELLEIVPDRNQKPSYTEIQSMKYLEMVIKETLRLYPAVPLFLRTTKKPLYINDMLLPANTSIFINTYNMHRDPMIYPDPDTFNPERHSYEQIQKRGLYANLSFSAGPRNCLGHKIAMLILKTIIYKLILNFKFESSNKNVTINSSVILTPVDGVTVKLIKRE